MQNRLYNTNTEKSGLYISNCKLSDCEKKLLKKNPHCVEFFCTLKEDIKDCTRCYKFLKNKMTINFKDKYDNKYKDQEYDHEYCNKNCSSGYLYNYITERGEENSYNNYDNQVDKLKHSINRHVDAIIYKYSDLTQVIPLDTNIKYELTHPKPKTVVHWGQLKLLLTTIVFLMRVTKPSDKKVILIYAGSATGDATIILTEMFPYIEWYLIDPRKHNKLLYKNTKVKEILQDYFTDDTAKQYAEKFKNRDCKLLFMSDIREGTEDEKIIDNQASQARWHKILAADYSYLKFRCPYDIQKEYKYYDGEIFLQFYAPQSSTETRILFEKELKEKTYDSDEFQGKMLFFNRVIRPAFHKSLIKENDTFDMCYDCVYFGYIIKNYLNEFEEVSPFIIPNIDKKQKIYDVFKIMNIILNKLGKNSSNKIKNYNEYIRNNIL